MGEAGGFDLDSAPSSGSSGSESKPASRISIPLTADGSLDISTLRPKTADKLKKAIKGCELFAPEEPPAAVFSPELVPPIYKLLGEIEVPLAIKVFKIPADIARQVFIYSDPEIVLLTDPTARVLNKHGGEWLRRYGEEIGLVLLLAAIHQQKIFMAAKLNTERINAENAAARDAERNEKESMNRIKEEFAETVDGAVNSD